MSRRYIIHRYGCVYSIPITDEISDNNMSHNKIIFYIVIICRPKVFVQLKHIELYYYIIVAYNDTRTHALA